MTALVSKAFEAAAQLSVEEQDNIARTLLAEIEKRLDAEDDARWDKLFADQRSEAAMRRLSDEALADFAAGHTRDGDPSTR